MNQATDTTDGYLQARDRFLTAARAAGARLSALPIDAQGPSGEALFIDIAWLGAQRPRGALLHVSGVHGVEAYIGSEIQCGLLGSGATPGQDQALILVHALNPWGMAWWRRVNEHNVDLNRNFLAPGEIYAGSAPAYARLDALLNPTGPPCRDAFALRATLALARFGFRACRDAILGGQYDYPAGLFFGGSGPEPSHRYYRDWLVRHLHPCEYLLTLDVHSGLGRYAEETLLFERQGNVTPAPILGAALGKPLQLVPANERLAYRVRGGHGGLTAWALPNTRCDFLTQEFGTYSMLQLLAGLRDENRAYQDSPAGSLRWRRRLLEALYPKDPQWRRQTRALGVSRAMAALTWLDQA